MMDLTRDAMLVTLRIHHWSGKRYDRKASDHVAHHHDADTDAGRYTKRLLPKAAFAALTKAVSAARTAHYDNTLPWDDQGRRLLSVDNFDAYTTVLDGCIEQMVGARTRFIETTTSTWPGRARTWGGCSTPTTTRRRRRWGASSASVTK